MLQLLLPHRTTGRRALVALMMTTVTSASMPASGELRLATKAPKLTLSTLPTAPVQISKAPPLRLPAMITLATGAATIGVSIFLGLRSRRLERASFEHCPDAVCSSFGADLQQKSTDFREAATITMAAGGALLLSGGLMLILGPKPGIPRLDGARAGVRIVPGLGRVDLKGTF